jgi:hypothetical protein
MHYWKITIFSTAIALLNHACYADNNRVWAEQLVGRASTNWDLSRGQTEITEIYLQVVGPSNLPNEVVKAVENCAGISLSAAVGVYYYTVGEMSVKLAQAYGTFKGVFWTCVRAIPVVVWDEFNIEVARKKHAENGIFATAVVENPNAVFIDKYVIPNAPKESRDFLSIANRIFNRSWSLPNEQSNSLGVPGQLFSFYVPTPPIISFVREISKIKFPHVDLPNLPEVKLPKL